MVNIIEKAKITLPAWLFATMLGAVMLANHISPIVATITALVVFTGIYIYLYKKKYNKKPLDVMPSVPHTSAK